MKIVGAFGICCMIMLVVFGGSSSASDLGKPGELNGPPVGITSVAMKLQSVLDANDAAVGRLAHKSITDIEEGTVTAYGLAGHYRDVYAGLHSGDDSSSTFTVGPFTSRHGRLQGQRWHQDENGITNVVQDTVRADENSARGFVSDTENPKNDVALLGEVASPVAAYVVQVKRKGNAAFWSFFDKKTGLLDRVELGYSDERDVFTYDDYRSANGIKEAWHTHSTDGNPQNDYDSHITSDTYGVAVTDADLAIPPSRKDFLQFPAGKTEVDLPSDIAILSLGSLGINLAFADPLIRVTINGRGLDMLLDSTEKGMVLDDQVAKELGLTTYGPYDKDDKGHFYPTRSVVSSLAIGDLQMHNVVVSCRHYGEQESTGAKAVGAIGYDFLANAVVAVDYVHRNIKAYDPVEFLPPSDSVPTPVNVDDGIPFVSAQVGNAVGDYFLLDTTAPFTALFPSFWQAHPDDVKDQGKGRAMNSSVFHSKDSGEQATELKALTFGGVRFTDWMAFEYTDAASFEGVDSDGIIGYDFLQYFNVFLDYSHHQVYLEPNDVYKRNIQR